MPSLGGGTGKASARDKSWTEYVDTLKDSLMESKEFVASMMSSQETLMKELLEEHKQMKTVMVQNTKLMTMLEANNSGKGDKAGGKSPDSNRPQR